jgi:hypothetical protein
MKVAKLSSKKKTQVARAFSTGVSPVEFRGHARVVQSASDALEEVQKPWSAGAIVRRTKDGSYVVEPLGAQQVAREEAKKLRVAKRHYKDLRFSRGAKLMQDLESTEATSQIAKSTDSNLSRNRDTYQMLFEKALKPR